ncbi:MAG: transglycosylase domain-containing protein, partial [Bacteroidia bacterium]|nr:transglycosylase domain-containing protein [Bacteroidia bacterium]
MKPPKVQAWIAFIRKHLTTFIQWIAPYLRMIGRFFKALWLERKVTWRKASWFRKLGIVVVEFFLFVFLYLFCVDVNVLWLFGKSPSLLSISNPQQSVASEIYREKKKIIGKFFKENRTPVTFGEIAPIMVKTLIFTEDERFYQHFGIDIQGLFAVANDVANG